jgi:hypothetical protein
MVIKSPVATEQLTEQTAGGAHSHRPTGQPAPRLIGEVAALASLVALEPALFVMGEHRRI